MSAKKGEILSPHYGPFVFADVDKAYESDGKEVIFENVASVCRCGQSKYKPHCDGSHSKEGFVNEKDEERKKNNVKDYEGENITIHDNRSVCCHDGSCVELLPEVFRKSCTPWINPDGSSPGKIIKVIEKCPSGALSFSLGSKKYCEFGQKTEKVIFVKDGPVKVEGKIEFKDYQSDKPECSEHYTLCRCGKSKNKPFCDGTHDDTKT